MYSSQPSYAAPHHPSSNRFYISPPYAKDLQTSNPSSFYTQSNFSTLLKATNFYHSQNIQSSKPYDSSYNNTQKNTKNGQSHNYAKTHTTNSYANQHAQQPVSYTSPFLHKTRSVTQFIGASTQVIAIVHEIYEKLTRRRLQNIIFTIANTQTLKKVYPNYHDSILGFAINSQGYGPHQIYIKEDYLDSVLLTIGHEIGHVLSPSLPNNLNEEAKAFAFELAWAKLIKEENIANLGANIKIHAPAQNGLHNLALDFVLHQIQQGITELELFDRIASGELSVTKLSDALEY
jgi:hypothetical protein